MTAAHEPGLSGPRAAAIVRGEASSWDTGTVALPRLCRDTLRLGFALLVLASSYDKSGVLLAATSVSYYKLIFVCLTLALLLDPFRRPRRARLAESPLRWIQGFVAVQTLASLAGMLLMPGEWSISSEVYYVIQRSSFLLIPLLAWNYGFSPRGVLRLFVAAVLLHYGFLALQFAAPPVYGAFVSAVYNPIRPDNSFGWSSISLNFIGLQRTAAYGAFASAFGVLFLALSPRIWPLRLAAQAMVALAILIALVAGSRSVLLMTLLAIGTFVHRAGYLRRRTTYIVAAVGVLAVTLMVSIGTIGRTDIGSLDAFFSPEREASTIGKISNAKLGWDLFSASPLVGYGQRRFAALTLPLGNNNIHTSETHSFVLSTVLSSGLIGFIAYVGVFLAIARPLLRSTQRDAAVVGAMFVGLNIYNVIYDAGGLDLFACFNGVAAYFAMHPSGSSRTRPRTWQRRRSG